MTQETAKWIALGAVGIALAAGLGGYKAAMARAPEVAAAIRADTETFEAWTADLAARPAEPIDRAAFCEGVMQGAADVLWQEQMQAEGDATQAMHDAYRN